MVNRRRSPAFVGALHPDGNRQIQHKGELGLAGVAHKGVEPRNLSQLKAATIALIGGGRVRVSVAYHNPPGVQAGQDDLMNMLRPVGEHEQQFSPGSERIGRLPGGRA